MEQEQTLVDEQTIPEQMPPNYQWQSDEVFEISGSVFEALFKNHAAFLQSPKAQEVQAMMWNMEQLNNIFQAGIASGKIVDANKK